MKERDFKNVEEAWKSIKLLIYTQTLVCGVNYNVQDDLYKFDTFVHVYLGVSNPDEFMQSTLWVRQFWDKEHILFIKRSRNSHTHFHTISELFYKNNAIIEPENMFKSSIIHTDNFTQLLKYRESTLEYYSREYIISSLKDAGYTLKFAEKYTNNIEEVKVEKLKKIEQYDAETIVDLKLLQNVNVHNKVENVSDKLRNTCKVMWYLKINTKDKINSFNSLETSVKLNILKNAKILQKWLQFFGSLNIKRVDFESNNLKELFNNLRKLHNLKLDSGVKLQYGDDIIKCYKIYQCINVLLSTIDSGE